MMIQRYIFWWKLRKPFDTVLLASLYSDYSFSEYLSHFKYSASFYFGISDFNERKLKGHSYEYFVKQITETNFSISLSVKHKEGHLFLCDSREKVTLGNCFWIKLAEEKEKTSTYDIKFCKRNELNFDNGTVKGACSRKDKRNIASAETSWNHLIFRISSSDIELSIFNHAESLVVLNTKWDTFYFYIFDEKSSENYNKWIFHDCK